jgi:uncharacterized RDD family membrane protein YckC
MEYEDRHVIATPEGVELAVPLAGLGSRFMAALIDLVIQIALTLFVELVGAVAFGAIGAAVAGGFALLLFVLTYDVLCEVLGGGRTIGKRAASLRVVLAGGAPVDLRASLIRNIIRLFELSMLYVPSIVSILATRDNQRLGDLAAGTLVVRDARPAHPTPPPLARRIDPSEYASWDATAVGEPETIAVRAFLERREQLNLTARRTIAAELAGRLRPQVAGAQAGLDDEAFLELLSVVKAKHAG